MRAIFINLVTSACVVGAFAAELNFDPDVTKWEEVIRPPKTNAGAYAVWDYAASYSELEWHMFMKEGEPRAQLRDKSFQEHGERPRFIPKVAKFGRGAPTFARVDDGWLVGFNDGEWGGAFYWFREDGKRNYKISDHQIEQFFMLPTGIHAIEGLAHISTGHGSVVCVSRKKRGGRWRASEVVKLPAAPSAISLRQDGTMLITLSDRLVAITPEHRVETLLANPNWIGLYASSSVLTRDERKLYLGMRQFVVEVDLNTKKLRFLIPSKEFLNRLPKDQEERIRMTWGYGSK